MNLAAAVILLIAVYVVCVYLQAWRRERWVAGKRVHELKIWPVFYQTVVDGRKTYELREIRDRNFQIGDVVVLKEWDNDLGFTGRETMFEISYMTVGPAFGIKDGWCVLALGEI